jgi:hypothetical protein
MIRFGIILKKRLMVAWSVSFVNIHGPIKLPYQGSNGIYQERNGSLFIPYHVAICREVTKEVQEAAFLALCGGNKRHKSTARSVNVNDCGISTMVGGIGRVQREVQVVEPGVGEERISSHAIAGNDVVSMTGM